MSKSSTVAKATTRAANAAKNKSHIKSESKTKPESEIKAKAKPDGETKAKAKPESEANAKSVTNAAVSGKQANSTVNKLAADRIAIEPNASTTIESKPKEHEPSCEEIIGYTFKSQDLLRQALTHKSYHNEHTKKSPGHNERLEFLGDAVLDLSLSTELMKRFSEFSEGELSKARASLVNEKALSELATEIKLDQFLYLGKGETQTGGAMKPRLLACAVEALLGAVFLDSNYENANEITLRLYKSRLENFDTEVHFKSDYKTRLQEKLQGEHKQSPVYELEKEIGPDHDKVFHVILKISDQIVSRGAGRSKKQAEQEAAKLAWESL